MVKLAFNPESLSPKDRAIYEAMVTKRKKQGATFSGPYASLMNHPELCEKIEALGYYLKYQGHLARDVYQFIVLAVSRKTGCRFEWDDHIQYALKAGLPKGVIDALKVHGVEHQEFPVPYQYAAEVLNATLSWQNIPAEAQENAVEVFGMLGFIELVVVSGFYQMFSAINQGFDITKV